MSFTLTERELDFNKWKVVDLKKELRNRGLSVDGKKNDLVERLTLAVGESTLLFDSVTEQDETLLDEDVLTDYEPFEDLELAKPETPQKEKPEVGLKRKFSKSTENITGNKQPKKIVLNRNVSVVDKVEVAKTEGKENQEKPNMEPAEEKPTLVKVGALSPQERLERRAAKFGVAMSNEAKKEARAARFGLPTAGSKIGGLVNTNIDVLKKRAERFGTTLPGSILEKAEIEEKRKKREERFGKIEKTTTTMATSKGKSTFQTSTLDEKKRLRAERFKIK